MSASPGRFMVAVAAVLEHEPTGKLLMLRRSAAVDFAVGVWEEVSGRLHQDEPPEDGLRREIREETGIAGVEIVRPLRVYGFFRGPSSPEFAVVGIAFWCRTRSSEVVLSHEHDEYRWVTPDEALGLAGTDGIRESVRAYLGARRA